MQRRSLIKCILGLAAAPKILAEMDLKPPMVPQVGATASLFKDLQFVTPQFMGEMIKKYGNENFTHFATVWGKPENIVNSPEFFWWESSGRCLNKEESEAMNKKIQSQSIIT